MPVKFDMDIYAKWTSRIPVKYTIRYVYKSGEEYVDIAESTTGASLAGVTKSFMAKVGVDLYEEYRVGYFPDMRAHSMTMSTDADDNRYFFLYTIPEEIKYRVTHTFTDDALKDIFGDENNSFSVTFPYVIDGEDIGASAAYVILSFRDGITKDTLVKAAETQYDIKLNNEQKNKLWETITKLSPDWYLQEFKLTTISENNEAIFEWAVHTQPALYQVVHYIESIDGTEYDIHITNTYSVEKDTVVTAEVKTIDNFTFDPSHPGTVQSGTAKVTWNTTNGTLNDGLVLSLYYTRNSYSYKVYHYKQGTNVSLLGDTPPVIKTAKYQSKIKISDEAVDIDGYTLFNGSDSVEITANNDQAVICYYTGLEVYYQYQIRGEGGTIDAPTDIVVIGGEPPKPKTLKLWDDEAFILYAWYYAIDNGEELSVPSEWLSVDSEGNAVIELPAPEVKDAGKTYYVFAEVLPTVRRFKVEGFASPENDPQAFVFELKGADADTEKVDVTFFIFDVGHIDLALLPYGKYTLTTLHWAWRYGTPTSVTFGDNVMDASSGTVTLDLTTPGDVIITYPSSEVNAKWLTDDASGIVAIEHITQ